MKRLIVLLSFLSVSVTVAAVVGPALSTNSSHQQIHKIADDKSQRKHKRAKKKKLRKELRLLRKAKRDTDNSGYLILGVIFLGLLVLAGYSFLIFIFWWNSSGNILFALLLLVGWTAIIFGVIRIIKKLNRKRDKV